MFREARHFGQPGNSVRGIAGGPSDHARTERLQQQPYPSRGGKRNSPRGNTKRIKSTNLTHNPGWRALRMERLKWSNVLRHTFSRLIP
jgi:hypothetical protein